LEHRSDTDIGIAENVRNPGDHAGAILDRQSQVIARFHVINGAHTRVEAMRHKRGHALFAAKFKIQGGVGQIGDDRARGRVRARAAAIEHCVADHVAVDDDTVEDSIDAGEDVTMRDERRMHAHLDGGEALSPVLLTIASSLIV